MMTDQIDVPDERNSAEVIDIKTDYMEVRRRLRRCTDPIAVTAELRKLKAEFGLPMDALKKCAREIEREKKERRQFGSRADPEQPEHDVPLQRNKKGDPYPIVHNAIQVLRVDPRWKGILRFNQFSGSTHFAATPPFAAAQASPWTARDIQDTDDTLTAAWMQQHLHLHVSSGMAAEAMNAVALDDSFHPVRQYLSSLVWDGTPRIDLWLEDHFGVPRTPYTCAIASKTLISAVARVFSPGCQVDTVLTLIGEQGMGKSKAFRILASPEWFSASLHDMHTKDAMQHLRGRWIIELAELSALARSDLEAVKNYISRADDGYRPSFGRRDITVQRQCIFVATTNHQRPLKDVTGNRRWWPVEVTQKLDAEALTAARDQLWAEAVARYHAGEIWYLTGETEEFAIAEQRERVEDDDWQEQIMNWMQSRYPGTQKVPASEIYAEALKLEIREISRQVQTRVTGIMARMGWQKSKIRHPLTGCPCWGFSTFTRDIDPKRPPSRS